MTVCNDTVSEKLYYIEAGEGIPIIFLHGNLATGMGTFAPQIMFFSNSFRCICPDLRCHGKSFSRNTFWTTEDLSEDVFHLMNSLSVDKAHFVGHSMGGDVMMYILLNHKDRVLTATSLSCGGSTNNRIINYMKRFDPDSLDPVAHSDFIHKVQQEHGIANQGDWKQFLKQTIWNAYHFPGFTDEELRSMDKPFQLIMGTKDRLVQEDEIERLRTLIPNIHFIEIDGGHTLTSDEKTVSLVNRYIYDFISR